MTKPTPKRNRNTRISPEAKAEQLLAQSLLLRLGQEAARQNGIETEPYLPLTGDPHRAHLAALNAGTTQNIKLRATITLEVNPNTGAAIALHLNPQRTN